MRTPTIATVSYAPYDVPNEPAQLPVFLRTELARIRTAIELLALGHIEKSYSAPPKPRDGDIRYADGASWNPGSGKGLYAFNGTSWVLITAL